MTTWEDVRFMRFVIKRCHVNTTDDKDALKLRLSIFLLKDDLIHKVIILEFKLKKYIKHFNENLTPTPTPNNNC